MIKLNNGNAAGPDEIPNKSSEGQGKYDIRHPSTAVHKTME